MLKMINKLGNIGADKYLHVLVCQCISFVFFKLFFYLTGSLYAGLIGLVIALVAGILKEIRDTVFDWDDLKADLVGGILGILYGLFWECIF